MLSISIVVYSSDISLLLEVISSLHVACQNASLEKSQWQLDIINNNANEDVAARLSADARWSALETNCQIKIVTAPNDGYGAGNNISIFANHKKYHLVLNPDVILSADCLKLGLAYMNENPDIGLLVPRVEGFDGEIHYLCKNNPTLFDLFLRSFAPKVIKNIFNKRMQQFEMREKDYEQPISPVPFPTGCFMLFRTQPLKEIGGFDTTYFLHLEDADIGRRINKVSKSIYLPLVRVKHKWTRGSHNNWRIRLVTIQSAFTYWKKWGGLIFPTK